MSTPVDPRFLQSLRTAHPLLTVAEPVCAIEDSRLVVRFRFTVGQHTFEPSITLSGLEAHELARANDAPARELLRALAVVEAFSYWKAFCSPELVIPGTDDQLGWWNGFWAPAMGEFFYRNDIDFTQPGFLELRATGGPAPAGGTAPEGPALVMFSGGKDSLALTLTTRKALPIDVFLYNPTPNQIALTQSLEPGRVITLERQIRPELLRLNDEGRPNGHTPYSAYLAFAAMLAGYLRGNRLVLAGNSRSDDEPNISAYRGRPINHQWTKTYEFEANLADYRHRWVPAAPPYASPLRPLFELQIISLLADDVDAYLRTASCNQTRSTGWCRACAKCAWVFLATSVLFGHDLAVTKLGGDLLEDRSLAGLYERMAGLHGTKPFECTGSEDEVRASLRSVLERDAPVPAALLLMAEDTRLQQAPTLGEVLADWGADDLVPEAIRPHVEKARGQG
ncbi:hypothetical protein GCM10022223_30010 [Kineosporia mesophila]|uniref:UDP-N-acetyl-alpha-D-muramoyl-L-alanyl-L-glutamate epimerase n=1 Tax=Kineosporia mesophila TaxID=566012 RepID=A0ABP6ZQD4_9ACTN|nr:hypothetical protein [Kineosporia mesophila]MCD5349581.1 hypothetical protein [Kineosporia mesophila]